jgi:hypothetical protein
MLKNSSARGGMQRLAYKQVDRSVLAGWRSNAGAAAALNNLGAITLDYRKSGMATSIGHAPAGAY